MLQARLKGVVVYWRHVRQEFRRCLSTGDVTNRTERNIYQLDILQMGLPMFTYWRS